MADASAPTRYYVVFCTTRFASFAEAQAKASAAIAEHVMRSQALHEQGLLVMAGAFLDRPEEPLRTMGVLTSREAADAYIAEDPFYVSGMLSEWSIREWANMFA